MDSQRVELVPLLERRNGWLFLSTTYANPPGKEFELFKDSAFQERRRGTGAFMARKSEEKDLGLREVSPGKLPLAELFACLDSDRGNIEPAYQHLFEGRTNPTPCGFYSFSASLDLTMR